MSLPNSLTQREPARARPADRLRLMAIALLILAPSTAHAYIDPGTGSYAFQMLLAGLLGLLFAFKSVLRRIRAFLSGRPGRRDDSPPTRP